MGPSVLTDPVIASISLRTLCLLVHVGGVVLGMGGAVFLDLFLLRHLHRKPIDTQTLELLHYGGMVVAAGLGLLWLSGLGFLVLYGLGSPAKLDNPKLLAKLGIVLILTINGALIHRFAFAAARRSIGRPLLQGASLDDALPLLTLGAVSSVSWGGAFLLGMVREWNNTVPAQTLFATYLLAIVVAIAFASGIHLLAGRIPARSRPAAASPHGEAMLFRARATRHAAPLPTQTRMAA